MKIIIKVEKDDILVDPIGKNIAIVPGDGPVEAIIFDPKAAEELAYSIMALLDLMKAHRDEL